MPTNRPTAVAATRRPARDLIEAVLDNMRRNLEPLKYSTLAPSRFVVYLHPGEYARLEGIVGLLREETVRALAEELDRLNRRLRMFRYAGDSAAGRKSQLQTRRRSGTLSLSAILTARSPRATF